MLVFLLLVLCTSGSAQTLYPNELPGYQFFGSGKLKGLQLLVSSKNEVQRIFGASCEKRCDYDREWFVIFEYFENIWIKESSTNNGERQTYMLDPKFVGKLRSIELRPKIHVSFLNILFPASFEHLIVTSTTDARGGRSRMIVNDAYQDSVGLSYEIYGRTDYDDIKQGEAYNKGDLILVRYNLSKETQKGLFTLKH